MMNDIEMPLLESQSNNVDNESIKYAQRICLYLLSICMGMTVIMLISEYILGRGDIVDIISKIVVGISLTVSSVLISILLYIINS